MGRSAIHPGEHLAEQLAALDMSAAALGRQLNVRANRITEILNGQRAITGDTALRLGHFFSTNPQFWLSLQAIYDWTSSGLPTIPGEVHDLRVAEQKTGTAIKTLPTLNTNHKKHGSNQPRLA